MGSLNQVILIGNLTRDPETKNLQSGDSVTSCGIAMNKVWMNDRNEKQESVTFVDFEIWGKKGEAVAQYCRKGKQVCVSGELKMDEWEDRETGQKRSKLKVRAFSVVFLGSKADDEGGGQQQGDQQQGGQRQQQSRPAGNRAPQGQGRDAQPQGQGGGIDFDDIPFSWLIAVGMAGLGALGMA